MSVDETVCRLAALKAFGDHIKAETEKAKALLAQQMRRGTVSAFVEDGDEPADVGTVVVVPTRWNWDVVDEAAFTNWVKANRPTAIVESVRSSDKKSILDGVEKSAKAGGDVPDGVARVKAAGYVSVKQSADQLDALLAAAADGRLPVMLLPAPEGIEA